MTQVLAATPKDAEAHLALGTIAANTGRPSVAIDHFKRVIILTPGNAQAQFSIGLLLAHEGRYDEAIPCLERAIAAQPENIHALVALGQSHFRLSQPTRALDYLNRAIRLKPDDADLRYSRAACFCELLRYGEAESDLRAAIEKLPTAKGLAYLAEIELSFNRASESLLSAESSIAIDPSESWAYSIAAQALMSLDRFSEAEEFWSKAREFAPDLSQFLSEKANAFISLGQFEQARRLLLEAIEANPTRGQPYFSIVSSKKNTDDDLPFLGEVERLCQDPGLPDEDRLQLLYSLGKANDDLRNYGTAIGYFDEANRLKQSMTPKDKVFDREQLRRSVDLQIDLYTPSFFEEHENQGDPSTMPLFVVGMMRSGTTLLEQILSCHPRIGGAGEQSFWPDHESELMHPITGKFKFQRLEKLAAEYLQILQSAAPGFERVIDKNPANVLHLGLIATAFANAKIVHIHRHPVDTVLSIWMTPMKTTAPFICDRSNLVFAYQQYQRLSEHYRKAIPARQYLEIDYEALTEDPEKTIREVLQFCNLDWDAGCLRPDLNKRPVRTPSFWQARQPVYRSSTQRWKRYEPWLGEFASLLPGSDVS